jgi:uncharacterized integral membrane protein (TIGR00698 family)
MSSAGALAAAVRLLRLKDASWWLGLALAGAVAWAAWTIGALQWARELGLSTLTIAIVLGIAIGNSVFPVLARHTARGVDFSKTALLRAGIVLYGFRITFQQIADIGWAGVVIDALMVALTFTIAVQLGTRVLRLDRRTSMLIGAGSAICGAAAVLATEPVLRAPANKVSVAVATVVVFGTVAMFLYPLLYPYLGLSQQAFGIFTGSTVHEVAQVVAASRSVGETAASTAVIEKMLRVMMLAPFLMMLSTARGGAAAGGAGGRRVTIPGFAVLFLGASALNSLHLLSAAVVSRLLDLDTALLAMAMAALGLRTHAAAVRQAGIKPLLLAAALFAFLVVGGYAVNRVVLQLIG